MEGETKKRGREEGEEKMDWFAMKTAKTLKQEMFYHNDQQQQHCNNSDHQGDTRQEEESDESYISSDVGLGVFDFPWLHENEGMMSKSDEEYWNFQDTFSCSLDPPEADRQCLYETPTTPPTPTKLEPEEINVWPLEGEEMESVDCIWSWMVNHPLQQPHH